MIRQLGALIGDDALHAGLGDYLTRYRAGGAASLDDLVGCWSRASGRELTGWADEWLRTEGASLLSAELTPAPDGTIRSLAIRQDARAARPPCVPTGSGSACTTGTGPGCAAAVVSVEVSGGHTDVPEVAGEQPPSALILNDGDLSYARIGFDEATLRALAAAAMDVGDPLTEAVCWNAAWQLVSRGQLAAADLATLIARRVGALPLPGVEVLLERAVGCADVYAPPSERAGIRERVAEAAARLAGQAAPGSPRQRALAARLRRCRAERRPAGPAARLAGRRRPARRAGADRRPARPHPVHAGCPRAGQRRRPGRAGQPGPGAGRAAPGHLPRHAARRGRQGGRVDPGPGHRPGLADGTGVRPRAVGAGPGPADGRVPGPVPEPRRCPRWTGGSPG